MGNAGEIIKNFFSNHFLKILFFIFFSVFLFIAIFPTSDLSDLVTNMVSEQTNKQVYLQFDDLGFTILPSPGIGLKKVYLETAMAPAMNIEALTVSPSIRSLLSFKQGLSAVAEGFLGGDVDFTWREGGETKKGETQQNVDIELENVKVSELLELIEAPVKLNGEISGQSDAVIDPTFSEQPEGDIELTVNKFRFPASPIQTNFGPIPLPEIKISKVTAKARMVNGELFIDELKLGDKKDQLNGIVKGKIRLRVVKRGIQVTANPSRYEFDININVLPELFSSLQLYLGILDNYKQPGVGSTSYCLKVSGLNLNSNAMPKMEAKAKCL